MNVICIHRKYDICILFSNDWADAYCINPEECPYREPLKNADRIRDMTDEELADVLRKAQRNQRLDMPWLSWLKQEAEE